MTKTQLWNITKILLKVIITGLLLYFVFLKIDVQELKNLFLKSNIYFILLALGFYFLSQVFASWRLLSFLKSIDLNLSFGFNFRLYLLGMFYNVFLPGGIGGDGYKIYLLKKKFQLPTKKLFLALLFDRISGLWAIGLLIGTLMLLIPKIEIPPMWPITALGLGTLAYYLVVRHFFSEYSKRFITAHLKAGVVQSLQLVSVICILLSQNFDGKFSPYLFSFLVSSLATIIPLSVGGLGIREYVMTHASGVFNMNESLAVFVSSTFWLTSTVAALPGIWFVYRNKEFVHAPNEDEIKTIEEDIV